MKADFVLRILLIPLCLYSQANIPQDPPSSCIHCTYAPPSICPLAYVQPDLLLHVSMRQCGTSPFSLSSYHVYTPPIACLLLYTIHTCVILFRSDAILTCIKDTFTIHPFYRVFNDNAA